MPAGTGGSRRGRPRTSPVLRHLQARIVVMTMAVALVTVALSCGLILGMTWNSNYQQIHDALARATQEGPSMEASFSVGKSSSLLPGDDGGRTSAHHFFPVAIYLLDADGDVVASNDSVVRMNDDVRAQAISAALASGSPEGWLRSLGVFYRYSTSSAGSVVAFADSGDFYTQMTRAGVQVGGACLVLLAALLLASVVFARLATRPVERSWSQQREFIANASHELKTPLTVIIANNDILSGHPEKTVAEQMRWVEGTRSEAGRMRELIEDMLTLARSDEVSAEERLTMTDLDLSSLVAQAALAFDAIAFEKGVTISDEVDPGVRLRGDKASMERLCKILVDNAVKYAGSGGSVRVRLDGRHRGHPVLSVSNTGAVIPKEDLAHVFERFWRSDAARTAQGHGGYGLGLSIAKNIAEAHGGRISAESSAEAGTTFSVSF